MFDAELLTNGDGKNFEFTGGLFVPLPGEYPDAPTPEIAIGLDIRPVLVPESTQVHFQKDFNRTMKMKMNPLDGERIKAREKNSNRVTFRFGARVSAGGQDS